MENYKSLIVSDYDETFYRKGSNGEILQNLIILRELIEQKVCFMISTGRMYESIFEEINKFNIMFNYVSCANGNVLFDEKFKLMWKECIGFKIIRDLKPYYDYILSIDSLDEYGIKTSGNCVEHVILLKEDIDIRRKIVSMIANSSEFDYCTDGGSKYKLHVFNRSNKTKTIEIVRKRIGIDTSMVYTIGDGINDIDMISQYNGFIVGDNLGEFEEVSLGKYNSFGNFIKDYKKGLIKKRDEI